MFLLLPAVLLFLCTSQNFHPLEASVRVTNYTDTWDEEYLDSLLTVTQLDKTTSISFDLDLKKELDSVEFDVRLSKRGTSKGAKYHQMIYTGRQKLCGRDMRKSQNLLVRYIAMEIIKHSNLGTRCPVKKGHYEIRNIEIDDRHLMMAVVPTGEFRIDVVVYHKAKPIKTNTWYVTAS